MAPHHPVHSTQTSTLTMVGGSSGSTAARSASKHSGTGPWTRTESCLESSGFNHCVISTNRLPRRRAGASKSARRCFLRAERLCHGEFRLWEYWVPRPDTKRQWNYRVKEFAWNADSTILEVWVQRDDGDASEHETVLPRRAD